MNPTAPTLRLLLQAGAALLGAGGPGDALGLEPAEDDLAALRAHGLLAALHTDAAPPQRERFAPALREAAEAEHRRVLRRNLQLVAQGAWLLKRLRAAEIDFLVCKGPVLAHAAWGHLGARAFGDLDLLVRERDLAAAADLLCAEGFEEGELPLAYERVFLHQPRSCKVELHARLVSRAFLPRLETARAWPAVAVDLPGFGRVPAPRAEFHLLFAGVHAAKHLLEFFLPPAPIVRLGLYVEIARWAARAPALDWEALLAECGALRCRRAFLHAPACARAWFGWAPPPPLARAIEATPGLDAQVARIGAGLGVTHAELKHRPAQLWRQARVAAGLRDSAAEGALFAARYFARPALRRLMGRA